MLREPARIAVALLLVACSEQDAPIPERTLGPPVWTMEVSAEPRLALLRGGRTALAVPGETRVLVIDDRGQALDSMGRGGEGPGEYRMATSLFTDTLGRLHVVDLVLRRITHYDADREHAGATPISAKHELGSLQIGPDGALYSLASLPGVEDSVVLVTTHGMASDEDPRELARLHRPARVLVPLGEIAINTPPEYAAFDAWGVLPGGTAWVARGADNRLELVGRDTFASGAAVPFSRISTTPADRDRWRGLPAPERFRVPTRPLAPRKGPFQDVMRAADGEFWFWLNQPAGHVDERYACRTLESAELLRIVVPNAHKLLALTPEHALLYGENAEGVPTLSAHPRPRCG